MKGLQGKAALVTGASSGIGQAIAVRLAQEGCHVAINYRSKPEAAAAVAEQAIQAAQQANHPETKVILVQGDVGKEADVLRITQSTIEQLGQLDILVNNAGIQSEQLSHEISGDDFDWIIGVNLKGSFLCAREAIKHLLARQSPGVIINISSVHEVIPRPRYLTYSMSKGGMGNLTKTLALEYADRGIRVNAIAPGATITPINSAWTDDSEKQEEVESYIPLGRAGTSDEMAAAVAFLASDEATYITGQTLFIDGGLTLYADFREAWSA